MKISYYAVLALLVGSLSVVGCAQKPQTQNSSEAIDHVKTLETVEAKTQYLVKEANAFVNSEQYDDAIKAAKYVLSKLDSNSPGAQGVIEKAKAEIEKLAQEKLEEAKKAAKEKLANFGK